jgi:hypothetical protein
MPAARRDGQRGGAPERELTETLPPPRAQRGSRVWSLRNQEASEGKEVDIPTGGPHRLLAAATGVRAARGRGRIAAARFSGTPPKNGPRQGERGTYRWRALAPHRVVGGLLRVSRSPRLKRQGEHSSMRHVLGGLSQISILGAKSEHRVSGIQWPTDYKILEKANLRQNPCVTSFRRAMRSSCRVWWTAGSPMASRRRWSTSPPRVGHNLAKGRQPLTPARRHEADPPDRSTHLTTINRRDHDELDHRPRL